MHRGKGRVRSEIIVHPCTNLERSLSVSLNSSNLNISRISVSRGMRTLKSDHLVDSLVNKIANSVSSCSNVFKINYSV